MKKSHFNKILSIWGINKPKIKTFYNSFGLNYRIEAIKFKRKQLGGLNQKIKKIETGKKLKEKIKNIINFSIKIRTYKGLRHKLRYPTRGQRTHTNAKTRRKFKY
jgi:small subunit ribosomal protein S13